jgi:hypothetical protein
MSLCDMGMGNGCVGGEVEADSNRRKTPTFVPFRFCNFLRGDDMTCKDTFAHLALKKKNLWIEILRAWDLSM